MVKYRNICFIIFMMFFLVVSEAYSDVAMSSQGGALKKPYVTCVFEGQLGNQMFQIATTLAHAWDNDLEPIFPDLNRTDVNIPTNRDRVFFRLNASPLSRVVQSTFEQKKLYEEIKIPVRDDQCLVGWFQTYKYFDHHRKKIIDIFSPRVEELEQIKTKHAAVLQHPCAVGVHVRTYSKQWSKHLPFVGLAYYEQAMQKFPLDALFVVFSDRINWCKHHFKKFNRSIIFIEGQDCIQDLFLMSMLKHNIIANSSFSWWAAYLNQNLNKMVIAPSHFHCSQKGMKVVNPNMPDWLAIDIDYNHTITPYPEDMCDYDEHSLSIDTQKETAVPTSFFAHSTINA